MMTVELNGELLSVPEGRGYRSKQNGGPFIAIDQHVGKTWACARIALPVGSVMETTVPAGEGEMTIRMRVVRPANRRELGAMTKKFQRPSPLAKGHWYEVHAD